MAYEVAYSEGIEDDFIEFDDEKILSIKERIEVIARHQSPRLVTERVMNTPLRKIRFGDFRIFLFIDDAQSVIYVLAIKNRSQCYKTKELNKVMNEYSKVKRK